MASNSIIAAEGTGKNSALAITSEAQRGANQSETLSWRRGACFYSHHRLKTQIDGWGSGTPQANVPRTFPTLRPSPYSHSSYSIACYYSLSSRVISGRLDCRSPSQGFAQDFISLGKQSLRGFKFLLLNRISFGDALVRFSNHIQVDYVGRRQQTPTSHYRILATFYRETRLARGSRLKQVNLQML